MDIVAYGLDYLRFKIFSDKDILHIATRLPYLELDIKNFHGSKFVDITGSQIEIIRMFDDVNQLALDLAGLYPVSRVDVFVDVTGNVLDRVQQSGTVIQNDGRIETIYSHHLRKRGDRPVFCRAYDARAAGHYEIDVTRFECEFKRENARALLNVKGWSVNPIGAMLHSVKLLLGVDIWIDDIDPVDVDAPRRKYEHNRERFYRRYGKGILNDIETMGMLGLADWILQCVQTDKEGDNGDTTDKD